MQRDVPAGEGIYTLMMEFIVLSRDKAKTYECDKPHIYISVKCPYDSEGWAKLPDNPNRMQTLLLAFDDWDDYQKHKLTTEFKNNPRVGEMVFFSNDHAKSIVGLVQEYQKKVEAIVCQCDAGISRSAGIAAALSKCIVGHDMQFFERYHPNRRVYRMILNEWYRGQS